MLAGLTPDQQARIAEAVVAALHPIYLISAGLALVALGFAFVLEEIELADRHVPKTEG